MTLPSFRLDGRGALVTGSSRGIGRAIALALAEAGADVLVHSRTAEGEAEAVAGLVQEAGRRSAAIEGDLSTLDGCRELTEAAERVLPALDILVLNAALQIPGPWEEITVEDIAAQLDVNLRASLLLIQHFVPKMVGRGWGRVLIIGSIQSRRPHPKMMIYAATKSALENMVCNLARQVAASGVTVNMLSPGVIETDRNAGVLADETYRRGVLGAIPLGRFGRPEDCAGAALLLCSEAGSFITGIELPVNGGGHLV